VRGLSKVEVTFDYRSIPTLPMEGKEYIVYSDASKNRLDFV